MNADRSDNSDTRPDPAGEHPPEGDSPAPVRVSRSLWLLGSVVFVAGYAMFFASEQEIIDAQTSSDLAAGMVRGDVGSDVTTWLRNLLVGALIMVVLVMAFAFHAIRERIRSGRTVATVLLVITAVYPFLIGWYNWVTSIGTLILIGALVLMYLPAVNPYFEKRPLKPPDADAAE